MGVRDRVVDQIRYRLPERFLVAVDRVRRRPGQRLHAELEHDLPRLGRGFGPGEHLAHEPCKVHVGTLQRARVPFESREREQVGHERAESDRVASSAVEESRPHVGGHLVVVEDRLDRATDRGDGRLELVADVSEEVLACPLEPPQVGDVAHHDDRALRLADLHARLAQRTTREHQHERLALRSLHDELANEACLAAHHVLDQVAGRRMRHRNEHVAAEARITVKIEQVDRCRVRMHHDARPIHRKHPLTHASQDASEVTDLPLELGDALLQHPRPLANEPLRRGIAAEQREPGLVLGAVRGHARAVSRPR